MANLAILGHKTRGKEVIEILEMLGGKNTEWYEGFDFEECYIIEEGYITQAYDWNNYMTFTLEEFLEMFPYKVGDKVTHNMGILMKIVQMYWDTECNVVRYDIQSPVDNNYKLKAMLPEHLQLYKEETMEEKIESFEILESHCADEVKVEFDPSKFEMVKRENGYYVVKKQPKYPKTYEECCKIIDYALKGETIIGYKASLLRNFQQLIICRDAYWKIAGDWKPTWSSKDGIKYGICVDCNRTMRCTSLTGNIILIFPTEEMRDAFYENFKELIESVKELL